MKFYFVIVWAVLALICFSEVNGLSVISEIDHATQTFKLPALNRNSTSNTPVGVIRAIDSNSVLSYALVDVTKDGSSTPKGGSWENRAKNLTADDCSQESLDLYPFPRKLFCIDHRTGEIYTTKYFPAEEPESGTFYKFKIGYTSSFPAGFKTYTSEPSPHSVLIYSNCDVLKNIYTTLQRDCNEERVAMLVDASTIPRSQLTISFNLPSIDQAYLTALKVDFSNTNFVSAYSLTKGDVIFFDIFNNNFNTNASLIYLSSKDIHIAYVELPPRLLKGNVYTVQARRNVEGSSQSMNLSPAMINIMFMERKDYCQSATSCISLAEQYNDALLKNKNECVNIDQRNFHAKYGYCTDNPAPHFTIESAEVDWDLIQYSKAPVDVLTNYISNIQGKDVEIKIVSVTSNQNSVVTTFNAKAHQSCSNAVLAISSPRAFFCINGKDGGLYTTEAFADHTYSDEDFTVQVEVSVISFPPSDRTGNVKVISKSLCRVTASLFRKLTNARCGDYSFPADIKTTKESVGQRVSHSVEFDLGNNDTIQNYVFYFAGIKLKKTMKRLPPEQVGSYISFILQDGNSNETVTAKYFYVGTYLSFSAPLQYAKDHAYTLSATRYDNTTGTESEYAFDVDQLEASMVVQKDYCSERTDCVGFYLAYQKEYSVTNHTTDEHCADPNSQGYKITYGYCQDNDAPTIRKTSYIMNIRTYVKAEILPATAQMYVTDKNPLLFELLEVTSVNTTDQSNNNNNEIIIAPKECTETFNTTPKKYFCISKTTGKIYTTNAIEGKVQVTSKFTLKVRVSDLTVFPIRMVDVRLSLSADDKCSPASLTYSTLSNCVSYSLVQPNISEPISYTFNAPKDFQVIIAVRFRLDDMTISKDAEKLSVLYAAELTNGTVKQNGTTARVPISQYIDEYSTVELNIPNNKMIRSVNITFNEHRIGGDTSVVSITANSGSLLYIEDFQCESSCSDIYNTWKTQATAKGAACLEDPLLYRRNFEVCRDVKPEFPLPPIINPSYLKTGDNVTISNCIYHSPYQIHKSDWRKDGVVLKNVVNNRTTRQRRSVLDAYPNLPGYIVEDLHIQNVKLANQGYYQCSVQDGGTTTSSGRVHLKLQDVATTDIELVLSNVEWIADYVNGSSTSYKDLQTAVQDKMKEKLLDGSPENLLVVVTSFTRFLKPSVTATRVMMSIYYAGSVAARETYCRNITDSFIEEGFGQYTVERVFIQHHNCCTADTAGELHYKGSYTFPATLAGQRSLHKCSHGNYGPYRLVSRQCLLNLPGQPSWEPLNVSFCQPESQTTKLLIYLFETSGSGNAVSLSRNLSIIVQGGNFTNQVDIELVADLITQVVNEDGASENVTQNVLTTIDGILDIKESLLVEANENKNTSSKLLQQLDELAAAQPANTIGKIVETKNIGFAVVKPTINKNVFISSATGNSTEIIRMKISEDNENTNINPDVSILLPASAIEGAKLVYSYIFKKTSLFQSRANITIQSSIMSATVVGKTIANLTGDKIEITFDVNEPGNETNMQNYCKFFVEDNTTHPWSSDGCTTIEDPVTKKVKCVCDHLTNFAIILDTSQTGSNPLALQIITWIGCGISLAGLILTIITYSIFKKLRRKLPPKILISLSFSLSALLIIFLAGAERVSPRIGCQVVAGLLQYFILSTFCWMAVEGLNLYRNFVKVFSGGASNTKFFIKASLFSWGLPAAITIATGAAKPDNLGPALDTDPQFCVVRGAPFFFAVLAPVVVVLIGNMIVLVLVLRGIKDGSQLVKDSKAQKNKKLTQARIAFACSVLLGLTWVFAILAVGEVRDFFQWMFCIFNSLQGFFIFVFYTLRSAEARREWKVLLGISTLERTSTSSKWHSKYISVYRLTHIGSIIRSRGEKDPDSKERKDSKAERKISKADSKAERKVSKADSKAERKISKADSKAEKPKE